ncbi:MAG: response regulator [Vicinamibacteria bacterium]|nr:response regulator [Vicinamibacteria bacterium]
MAQRSLKRILLVEDDPDIQEVTKVLLSHIEDFDVHACGSAAEGLEAARTFDPDLILLDVMMPGLDGQGAFAAFRGMKETATTPVIFMTARVRPGEILEYRQLGSLGVIPKPFDPDTLGATIQGMWDRHQNASANHARREDLLALRTLYAAELPERLRLIEGAAASLRQNGWDREIAESLYEIAHRLAGSAAIYGFPSVSAAALRVVTFSQEQGSGGQRTDPGPLLTVVEVLSDAIHESISEPQRGRPVS